jgi:hypothetical protein
MGVFSKACLAVVAVFGFAGTLAAKPMIFTCANSSNRQTSVIQGQIIISYDEASEEVFVSDGMILSVVGKPLAGKLNSDNALRTVFSWTVKNVVNSEGDSATLKFKGTYFKTNGEFLLLMQPLGFDNSFQDRGRCKVK